MMKGYRQVLWVGVLVLTFLAMPGVCAQAADAAKPSPELIAKGRALFNDKTGLGAKFACILCHKQGKEIQKAKLAKAGDNLPAVINKYLVEKSKGTPLKPDSENMKALMAYIRYEHAK